MKKKYEEQDDEKKSGQREVATLTNSYLMVDPNKLNGVLPRLYNFTDYNNFSRPTEDIDVSTGGITPSTIALPDPIIGKHIQLPDGDTTVTALSWQAFGEQDSGWIRAAADDYKYLVNGSSVTEWLASEFRVNYLTLGSVLFAGTSGKVDQDNARLFWDNTNKIFRITVPGPSSGLQVCSNSMQMELYDASLTTATAFFATNTSLLVTSDDATQFEYRSNETTGLDRYFGVYNGKAAGAFSANAQLYAHVLGATGGDPMVQLGIDSVRAFAIGVDNSDSDKFKISYSASSTASLGTNDRLAIDTSGNIGIGTTTPRKHVDILDTAQAQLRLTYTDNSVYCDLQVNGSGNLTLTPTGTFIALSYLTSGSVLFAGSSGAISQNNTYLFWDNTNRELTVNLAKIRTPGTSNIFVGEGSGNNTLTGINNTALGHDTLSLLTSSCNQNTAVGCNTLHSTTTGTHNTAVGADSMYYNQDGIQNCAFGLDTLYLNVSGNNNTAVGHQALFTNTASTNTACGFSALYTNSSGSANVAVGSGALLTNSTAHYNTAIGTAALNLHSTGDGNTALGKDAGYSNVSGSLNVFIGYQAGYSELGSNKLYISNSNTATPLILGDFSASTLSIYGLTSLISTAGNQLTIQYDSSNNVTLKSDSAGRLIITPSGTSAGIGATPITNCKLYLAKDQTGKTTVGDGRLLCLDNTHGSANELVEIGFGYRASNTYQPAVIGHAISSSSGSTKGTIYFGTRDVTTDTAPSVRMTIDSAGNVICNTAAIATSATDGFLYIPTCAGTPTGTPTSYTGRVPIIFDTTNNILYIYNTAWKGVALA